MKVKNSGHKFYRRKCQFFKLLIQYAVTAESSKPEKAQEISIVKCDNRYVVIIDKRVIKDVSDFKITTSADGTTELIIHIKTKSEVVKCDLSTV